MHKLIRLSFVAASFVIWSGLHPEPGAAHPLGNFTVNHFSRLEVSRETIRMKYVVDMAEIPAFGELRAADANGDGSTSQAELNAYLTLTAGSYLSGLTLLVDGHSETLAISSQQVARSAGAGGLSTLRVEFDLAASPPSVSSSQNHSLHFEDRNQPERIGWREIVVNPGRDITIFNSSVFENSVSDELRRYPADMLAAPLEERVADFQFTNGSISSGATPLRTRDGKSISATRDRFAELISVKRLTPAVALLGILIAALFGAAHALSPGHGKTVVGAYLVGSRGTPKHALFLGLTVTITHTAGVFALGFITLFASKYILPERLFPVLSLISGALVVFIGASLFTRRLASVLGGGVEEHSHEHDHAHGLHSHGMHTHSHGGRAHSHLPPGANGEVLTWRALLALGISGGLLPCPSALVVLLSAIALHRVGYGLLLVLSFSAGLAATLTGVGLAFVYAGRWLSRYGSRPRMQSLSRVIPVLSAFLVSCLGVGICYEAVRQMGIDPVLVLSGVLADWRAVLAGQKTLSSLGGFAVLTFGLILGIKHATEADHVIAVSNIVSEHRRLTKVALIGGLWGVGHTLTLVVVGVLVLVLGLAIPERVSQYLEFGIGIMIIALSATALGRALTRRSGLHIHTHAHGAVKHSHLHFHEEEPESLNVSHGRSHSLSRIGVKPLLVGAMHGLAGSAALTLLVLTQVHTILLGLSYLMLFGIGSIFGMMAVSTIIGIPFAAGTARLSRMTSGLQVATGVVGVCFGLWYSYSTGLAALHH